MIITDDTPASPYLKGGPDPAPPPGAPSQPPPPPYRPAPPIGPTQHYALLPRPAVEYRRSPAARFFRAFAAATLIWLLFSMLVRSIVELGRWDHRHGRAGWGGSVPADVRVSRCAGWVPEPAPGGSYPYAAGINYTLPVDRAVAVFSQGAMAGGSLSVEPARAPGDEVRVHVSVRYHSAELRDHASVCLARRPGDDVDGVGIFTPARWDARGAANPLYFAVTVTFPAGARGPLPITRFTTDLANYAHVLGALRGAVDFASVSLQTTNGHVQAASLGAADLSVTTTNAPILGSYNASEHLTLRTTNGAIDVDVALAHDPKKAPATLVLETTNAQLDAAATLASTNGTGGAFDVRAATTNERLALAFPEPALPAGARLALRAHTTNAAARVEVPARYEGAFALATTNAQFHVEDRALPDPAGQGRVRWVQIAEQTKRTLRGRLTWGREDGQGNGGSVEVGTTNGRVVLAI